MSEKAAQLARQRLDTPRSSRFRFNFDVEAVGRVGERIARFLGTGRYLMIQTIMVIIWIALNLFAVRLRWDPYPFILLNLAFSTQAAYAAPLILLAQNRQENRDRVALEEDRMRAARPRRTPSSSRANWRRCDWRWARSRPATTCAANSRTSRKNCSRPRSLPPRRAATCTPRAGSRDVHTARRAATCDRVKPRSTPAGASSARSPPRRPPTRPGSRRSPARSHSREALTLPSPVCNLEHVVCGTLGNTDFARCVPKSVTTGLPPRIATGWCQR